MITKIAILVFFSGEKMWVSNYFLNFLNVLILACDGTLELTGGGQVDPSEAKIKWRKSQPPRRRKMNFQKPEAHPTQGPRNENNHNSE